MLICEYADNHYAAPMRQRQSTNFETCGGIEVWADIGKPQRPGNLCYSSVDAQHRRPRLALTLPTARGGPDQPPCSNKMDRNYTAAFASATTSSGVCLTHRGRPSTI
jgi:hypothetical protein